VLDPVEGGEGQLDVGRDVVPGDVPVQVAPADPQLDAGEVRAGAAVDAGAEAEVAVGVPVVVGGVGPVGAPPCSPGSLRNRSRPAILVA
jgi:hypothetical protein